MNLKDHLEKLRYFYEAAKAGSIKEAAAVLNLTQPSVTKSIKILEDVIGAKLFIRQPRGVAVTTEGELLLNYCHTLFAQIEDMEAQLISPGEPMSGSIRVGTYDSIAIYFWPKFLKGFFKKYPHIDLKLMTDRSHTIQHKLENGELDLALIIEPDPSANVSVIDLFEDSFLLYRSTKMSDTDIDDMNTPLIYMPDALAGEKGLRLNHLLGKKKALRKEFKTSSLESVKELIIHGIGVGLLPKMVAQSALNSKKIAKVSAGNMPKSGLGIHRVGLALAKHKEGSVSVQGLIQEIQSHQW